MRASPVAALIAVVLGLMCLAGCTGPTPLPDAPTSPTFEGQPPEFSGPWSEEFTSAFRAAATDAQREVLVDEVVTADEYEGLRKDLVACMAELGAVVTFDANGGMTVDPGQATPREVVMGSGLPACESTTTGYAAPLYEQVSRNPDHLDEATIVIECLHEAGVVDDDYTAENYFEDLGSSTSIDWGRRDIKECTIDPLGLTAPVGGY